MAEAVNPGVHFAILVGGAVRTYRDDRGIALQAAQYLKERNPHAQVSVRDDRDGSIVSIIGNAALQPGKPR